MFDGGDPAAGHPRRLTGSADAGSRPPPERGSTRVGGGGEADVELPPGLTPSEVTERVAAGLGNDVGHVSSRSVSSILRANLLTRFNAIVTVLTVTVLIVGEPIDALFGLVMVLNAVIAIVQELRAKRSLDRLSVLVVPVCQVRRAGATVAVAPGELVRDDVILAQAGEQLAVDGVVVSTAGLEMDESMLTGESAPVPKSAGDAVLSGSAVSAGSGVLRATQVGEAAWARQLTREAKRFDLTRSELRAGIDRLLQIIGWALPPMAALMIWSQLRASTDPADSVVAAVAGLESLVPQGLVLLVSVAFAVGVTRLARQRVLVQELPALEVLARVDVVCVDKTGTLTTGDLAVVAVTDLQGDRPAAERALATVSETRETATADAVARFLAETTTAEPWPVSAVCPFSSVRKWSGVATTGAGTLVLGAPEVLIDTMAPGAAAEEVQALVAAESDAGRRVVLAARTGAALPPEGDDRPPAGLTPVALVVLSEQLRPEARPTVAWFADQGVELKVLSGDNPRTVSAVAEALGLPHADRYLDTRHVTAAELAEAAATTTVFGRIHPEQKREVIRALRAAGRTVAMIGDGVNDIPAIKAADIGVAVDTATPATRAVAQLVLLDGRFDHLPEVVAEGRRVVANMERVSSLFVTKTVYALVLAVLVAATGSVFPFLPRHLSLIGAVTIGLPGLALSFRRADAPCRTGYLTRVLRFSVPVGLVASLATFGAYRLALADGADLSQARSAATIALTSTGMWVLYRIARPVGLPELALLAGLSAGFGLMFIPPLSRIYGSTLPPTTLLGWLLASLLALIGGLEAALAGFRYRSTRG